MSHSNLTILIHLVWATHKRKNTIPDKLLEPLWEYFIGIGYNRRIQVIAAGGMPNHVHLAIQLASGHEARRRNFLIQGEFITLVETRRRERILLANRIWRIQLRHSPSGTGEAIHP